MRKLPCLMSRHQTGITLLALATGLASACGGGLATGPSAVAGGVWKVRSIETSAGGLVAVNRPENYTVEFGEGGRISARADCNTCSGTYSISGASLQIGALACTRAFCGTDSNDREFLEILGGATKLAVRGIELSIDSPKGTLRLNR